MWWTLELLSRPPLHPAIFPQRHSSTPVNACDKTDISRPRLACRYLRTSHIILHYLQFDPTAYVFHCSRRTTTILEILGQDHPHAHKRTQDNMDIDDLLAEVAVDTTPRETRDLQELTRLWVAERVTPEILPWPSDLMDRVLDRIRRQVRSHGGVE